MQSAKAKPGPSEKVQANQRPKIPFSKKDRVLLIGEGDFSFALSLVKHHRIQSLTATCYDSETELVHKYPNVKATIDQLLAHGSHPSTEAEHSQEDSSFEGVSLPSSSLKPNGTEVGDVDADEAEESTQPRTRRPEIDILYAIDATRLSTTHNKTLRPFQPFTKIVFNFPHTGGLSTDVNRQVRANQQLLVSFFESAKPFLLAATRTPLPTTSRTSADRYSSPDSSDTSLPTSPPSNSTPQIHTTLFTTPPYTLWNIRDLARHSGLSITSFRFPRESYPGYTHARTLGDITSGKDRSAEGKRKGAWRGEEREARTYVLELKADEGRENRRTDGGQDSKEQQQQRWPPRDEGKVMAGQKAGTGKEDESSDND